MFTITARSSNSSYYINVFLRRKHFLSKRLPFPGSRLWLSASFKTPLPEDKKSLPKKLWSPSYQPGERQGGIRKGSPFTVGSDEFQRASLLGVGPCRLLFPAEGMGRSYLFLPYRKANLGYQLLGIPGLRRTNMVNGKHGAIVFIVIVADPIGNSLINCG